MRRLTSRTSRIISDPNPGLPKQFPQPQNEDDVSLIEYLKSNQGSYLKINSNATFNLLRNDSKTILPLDIKEQPKAMSHLVTSNQIYTPFGSIGPIGPIGPSAVQIAPFVPAATTYTPFVPTTSFLPAATTYTPFVPVALPLQTTNKTINAPKIEVMASGVTPQGPSNDIPPFLTPEMAEGKELPLYSTKRTRAVSRPITIAPSVTTNTASILGDPAILAVAKSVDVEKLKRSNLKSKNSYSADDLKKIAISLQLKASGTKAILVENILTKLKNLGIQG